ncbi:NAD-dependent epimerase/dehydratase family protein [Paludifilum halophilum]|nr:NAD-dependent epimerase/dehydratase family protein [Paludifilum halophilum]
MHVLVTGGTGFLGRSLVHRLLREEYQVSVLVRSEKKRLRLPKEVRAVRGDVLDPDSLAGCCTGVDWVFHAAGEVAWGRGKRRSMFRTNVDGTKQVAQEALRAGVKRFVYTSSAAAVGFSTDGNPVDESFPFNGEELDIGYAVAKRKAEEEVLRLAKAGLPAVVVNPGVILGDGTPSFTSAVARGLLRVAPEGGVNLCDVRDVVRGHLSAAEKGAVGERYILGGMDLPLADAFRLIQRKAGKKESVIVLKRKMAQGLSLAAETAGWLTKREPALAWDLARLAGCCAYYSSAKAERELGYSRTPLEETISRVVGRIRE